MDNNSKTSLILISIGRSSTYTHFPVFQLPAFSKDYQHKLVLVGTDLRQRLGLNINLILPDNNRPQDEKA